MVERDYASEAADVRRRLRESLRRLGLNPYAVDPFRVWRSTAEEVARALRDFAAEEAIRWELGTFPEGDTSTDRMQRLLAERRNAPSAPGEPDEGSRRLRLLRVETQERMEARERWRHAAFPIDGARDLLDWTVAQLGRIDGVTGGAVACFEEMQDEGRERSFSESAIQWDVALKAAAADLAFGWQTLRRLAPSAHRQFPATDSFHAVREGFELLRAKAEELDAKEGASGDSRREEGGAVPGYLGIVVKKEARTITRNGATADLSGTDVAWSLFLRLFEAGEAGVSSVELREEFWSADEPEEQTKRLGMAKTRLNGRLLKLRIKAKSIEYGKTGLLASDNETAS